MSTDTETPPEIAAESKRKRGRPLKGSAPMSSSWRAHETRYRQENDRDDVARLALNLLRELTQVSPEAAKRYMAPDFTKRSPMDALQAMARTLHPIAAERVSKEIEAIKERLEKFTAEKAATQAQTD